jgi:hypothetical protein
MPNLLYNSAIRDMKNGSIDLDTDSIFVMLVTAAYVPNRRTHTRRSDITNEVVGTGYTAGGQALSGKTMVADNTNDRGTFDSNDPAWPASTITARGAVYYKNRGGAATADELILYQVFQVGGVDADVSSTNGAFTIQQPATGIYYEAQGP